MSRYPAAGKCFQKTSYPAVRKFDQFSPNSSLNSSKNIRYSREVSLVISVDIHRELT